MRPTAMTCDACAATSGPMPTQLDTRTSTGTGRSRSPTAAARATRRRTRCRRSSTPSTSATATSRPTCRSPPTASCVAFHDDDLRRTCGVRGGSASCRGARCATARVRRRGADPAARGPARGVAGRCASTSTARPTRRCRRWSPRSGAPARSIGCCVGAFSDLRLRRLRALLGAAAVHGARTGRRRRAALRAAAARRRRTAAQVPVRQGPLRVVTDAKFVDRAHRLGLAGPRVDDRRPGGDGAAARPRRRRDHDRPPAVLRDVLEPAAVASELALDASSRTAAVDVRALRPPRQRSNSRCDQRGRTRLQVLLQHLAGRVAGQLAVAEDRPSTGP